MNFCVKCGEKIEEGLNFCTKCGEPLGSKPQESSAASSGTSVKQAARTNGKTKLGISLGLLGAALYFMGLMGITPLVLLAGYVLLFEENLIPKISVVSRPTDFQCIEILLFCWDSHIKLSRFENT